MSYDDAANAANRLQAENGELQATVERLKRALKWYANPKNWQDDDSGVRAVVRAPEYGNPGGKARRALGMPSQRKKPAHA